MRDERCGGRAIGTALSGLLGVVMTVGQGHAQQWEAMVGLQAPSAHRSLAMAFDEARRETVLFGGLSARAWHAETWRLRSGLWTEAVPITSPPARCCHAMTYDMARQRIVLFGGSDPSNVDLADTWEWDGADWEHKPSAHAPPARRGHRMAFDPARGTVLLFGGHVGSFAPMPLDDTWEWDGADWTRLQPRQSPPLRYGHAMATDWARGEVVVHGGRNSKDLRDTWVWNGADWEARAPVRRPPGSRSCHGAYSTLRGRVVMVGDGLSTTWEWDGRRWWEVETALPSTVSGTLAGGFQWGDVVSFGGVSSATFCYRTDRAGLSHAGVGCGAPAPLLTANGPVVPGSSFSGQVTGCPTEMVWVLFNLAAPASGPISLAPWGAPGCLLEVEPNGAWTQHVPVSAGAAAWSLPAPTQPLRVGLEIHVQAIAAAPPGRASGPFLASDLCVASVY